MDTWEAIDLAKPLDNEAVISSDSSFRRGYLHGYWQAMDDGRRLAARQFIRAAEVFNILANHHDSVLRPWRQSVGTCLFQPAPVATLPDSWTRIRRTVLDRDGACVICDSTLRLEVDHITPIEHGGLPEPENLRTLCARCHRMRTHQRRSER